MFILKILLQIIIIFAIYHYQNYQLCSVYLNQPFQYLFKATAMFFENEYLHYFVQPTSNLAPYFLSKALCYMKVHFYKYQSFQYFSKI